ncbi:histone H1-like [Malania oleifera]|uniref:histone H1-like n=1 Tax=Malania oleifera TaxID=397392 RepID=UPI0025AEA2DB|nr:histone H1-like [Malania oleifera]
MAKAAKHSKLPSSALHPPYFPMICEAITSLKDRTGSSQPAIAKFIEDKYGKLLPPNFKKLLSVQLKKFAKSEKLAKVKNSYKIPASAKAKPAKAGAEAKRASVAPPPKRKVAKKMDARAEKTKRLSQVKTPEGLKKKKGSTGNATGRKKKAGEGGKTKSLSQVKTPDALKKTKKASTPAKRKAGSKSVKSSKKARN